MGQAVTVVFEPAMSNAANYQVYGIPPSGPPVRIASGWASGTTSIAVSGYDDYTFALVPASVAPTVSVAENSAVTIVFGSQQDLYQILWIIFTAIGEIWGNADSCDMEFEQFSRVIDWQVGLDPTYVVYYAAAVAEYTRLLEQTGSVPKALVTLFTENTATNPKLPLVQAHVLAEFMKWQVAFGGFRGFGPPYVNYSGWMGGGTFDQSPPPYRSLPGTIEQSGASSES